MNKQLFTLLILLVFRSVPQSQTTSDNPAASKNVKLNFMLEQGVTKGLEYAKTQSKPVLLYFNSFDCHSCEQFTDMVLTQKEVVDYAQSAYININANITNADARKVSRKYKAFMLPVVVLLNPDQNFEYTCKLSLEKDNLIQQMKSFFNAMALREQIILLQKTNNLSFEESARQIGASYAKIDFRKNATGEPELLFAERSLGMKYFEQCGEAYFKEWQVQKSKKKPGNP